MTLVEERIQMASPMLRLKTLILKDLLILALI